MKRAILLVLIFLLSTTLTPFSNSYGNEFESSVVSETDGRDLLVTYWKKTDEITISSFYSRAEIPNKNEILICESDAVSYDARSYVYSLNTMSIAHDVEIGCGSDTYVSPNFILDLQEEDESGNFGYYDVYETNNYQKVRTITFFGDQNLKADHIEISPDGKYIYAYEDSEYKLIKYNTTSWSIELTKEIRFYGDGFTLSGDSILSFYKKYPSGSYYSTCGYQTHNTTTFDLEKRVPLDTTEGSFFVTCDIPINSVNMLGSYFIERTGTTFSLRNISDEAYVVENVQLGPNGTNYAGYFTFDYEEDGLTFWFDMDDDENRSEHLLLWRNVMPIIENSNQAILAPPSENSMERVEYERYDTKPPSSSSFDMFDSDTILLYSYTSIFVYEQKVGYDSDGDFVVDSEDNCPSILNDDQANYDADNKGDACDDDYDNDGINNEIDNCSKGILNWVSDTYIDFDGDGCLDALEDTDDDNDGFNDSTDECPYDSNYSIAPEQGCGNLPVAPKPDEVGPQDDLPTELENELDTAKDKSIGYLSKIVPYTSIILNVVLVVYIFTKRGKKHTWSDDSMTGGFEHDTVDFQDNLSTNEDVVRDTYDYSQESSESTKDFEKADEPVEQQGSNMLTREDLDRFPGWDESIIIPYLEQGWTLDSLEDYYKEHSSK
jgi:hypothetical protein